MLVVAAQETEEFENDKALAILFCELVIESTRGEAADAVVDEVGDGVGEGDGDGEGVGVGLVLGLVTPVTFPLGLPPPQPNQALRPNSKMINSVCLRPIASLSVG